MAEKWVFIGEVINIKKCLVDYVSGVVIDGFFDYKEYDIIQEFQVDEVPVADKLREFNGKKVRVEIINHGTDTKNVYEGTLTIEDDDVDGIIYQGSIHIKTKKGIVILDEIMVPSASCLKVSLL